MKNIMIKTYECNKSLDIKNKPFFAHILTSINLVIYNTYITKQKKTYIYI